MTPAETLRSRLDAVRDRVAEAARRAGRDPAEVTIVAVTKSVGPEGVAALAALGQRDFGENRPQDLVAKRAALLAGDPAAAARVRWHMIGHFQRNKVRRALAAADVVHSLDSLALAGVLSSESVRAGRGEVPVLVQANVSGEATKGGFRPGDLGDVLPRIAALPGLRVAGLMTLAPQCADPEAVRPVFRRLRELRDWGLASGYLRGSDLSMGMSEDFAVAVEEGATLVRVGRAVVEVPQS